MRDRHRVGIYEKPLAIPPEAEVIGGRYHYNECPLKVKTPIDHRTFVRLMNHDKKADTIIPSGITLPQDAIFWSVCQKKRLNDSILASPTSPMRFDWRVHIIEGPDKVALRVATFVGLLLSFIVSVRCPQWLVGVITAGMAALYFQYTEP